MKYALCTAILCCSALFACSQNAAIYPADPELGFTDTHSAGFLAKQLITLGFRVKESTGVVAILKNGNGPVVMYRADMDCRSGSPVKHACEKGAHVSRLIGVAKAMAQMKNVWRGTLIVVGQPTEESILDAEEIVNDEFYSKHNDIPASICSDLPE